MKKYLVLFTILLFVFCGGENKMPSADTHIQESDRQQDNKGEKTEVEEHEHPELQLSPEKQKEWGIVLDTVSKQNISFRITLPGILTVNQNRTAHISSFVQGKVVSHRVDLGDYVRKGQELVVFLLEFLVYPIFPLTKKVS